MTTDSRPGFGSLPIAVREDLAARDCVHEWLCSLRHNLNQDRSWSIPERAAEHLDNHLTAAQANELFGALCTVMKYLDNEYVFPDRLHAPLRMPSPREEGSFGYCGLCLDSADDWLDSICNYCRQELDSPRPFCSPACAREWPQAMGWFELQSSREITVRNPGYRLEPPYHGPNDGSRT